ncbi:hypothetical protein ACFQRB_16235 [Halobaculum litoreum]|uniref:Uncharacterized protein n=1 Tax=Halobaculum litoreum TaxID=3031998 RepID=A0ABD5XR61_9EURY
MDRLQRSLPETTNLRPAIQKLTSDHVDLLGSFVDGFDSRREFIRWGQRAVILTLGELSGEWVADRAFAGLDLSVLVTSPARERWVDDAEELQPPDRAADMRRGVVATDLTPACSAAVRRLRWSAVEYVSDEDDTLQPDPDAQQHPGMRPSLTEVHERQRWALDRALEGFDSLDALSVWGQRLTEASYAEVPDDLLTRVTVDEAETRGATSSCRLTTRTTGRSSGSRSRRSSYCPRRSRGPEGGKAGWRTRGTGDDGDDGQADVKT